MTFLDPARKVGLVLLVVPAFLIVLHAGPALYLQTYSDGNETLGALDVPEDSTANQLVCTETGMMPQACTVRNGVAVTPIEWADPLQGEIQASRVVVDNYGNRYCAYLGENRSAGWDGCDTSLLSSDTFGVPTALSCSLPTSGIWICIVKNLQFELPAEIAHHAFKTPQSPLKYEALSDNSKGTFSAQFADGVYSMQLDGSGQ